MAELEEASRTIVSGSLPVPEGIFPTESSLARRFSRVDAESLTYEFTRDPALIHQYSSLYERECRVVYTPEFMASEKAYNERSHILVVRRGNFCIGGGRLTIRTPRITKTLPVELDDFRLEHAFPELKQKEMSYGEFSRLFILPEFRAGDVTLEMWRHFHRKCAALNLDVTYAAAPLANLRIYRKYCQMIGVQQMKIHMNVELPPYPMFEEVKDYLISMVVDKSLSFDRSHYADLFEPAEQ